MDEEFNWTVFGLILCELISSWMWSVVHFEIILLNFLSRKSKVIFLKCIMLLYLSCKVWKVLEPPQEFICLVTQQPSQRLSWLCFEADKPADLCQSTCAFLRLSTRARIMLKTTKKNTGPSWLGFFKQKGIFWIPSTTYGSLCPS